MDGGQGSSSSGSSLVAFCCVTNASTTFSSGSASSAAPVVDSAEAGTGGGEDSGEDSSQSPTPLPDGSPDAPTGTNPCAGTTVNMLELVGYGMAPLIRSGTTSAWGGTAGGVRGLPPTEVTISTDYDTTNAVNSIFSDPFGLKTGMFSMSRLGATNMSMAVVVGVEWEISDSEYLPCFDAPAIINITAVEMTDTDAGDATLAKFQANWQNQVCSNGWIGSGCVDYDSSR
jgi:hypothetical protein